MRNAPSLCAMEFSFSSTLSTYKSLCSVPFFSHILRLLSPADGGETEWALRRRGQGGHGPRIFELGEVQLGLTRGNWAGDVRPKPRRHCVGAAVLVGRRRCRSKGTRVEFVAEEQQLDLTDAGD